MNEYTQEPSFASKFSTKQTNITYVNFFQEYDHGDVHE